MPDVNGGMGRMTERGLRVIEVTGDGARRLCTTTTGEG
jgi:hypothetical protein